MSGIRSKLITGITASQTTIDRLREHFGIPSAVTPSRSSGTRARSV